MPLLTSRTLLLGSVAAGAVLLTSCGAAPPGDNGVPPWQQLGLGEQVRTTSFTVMAQSVEGNAAELELCYLNEQTGNARAGQWWVWTDHGGGFYAASEQTREPIYGIDEDVDCHRGWVEFDIPADAQITHLNFRPSADVPTEYTWQIDKPGT